MWTCAGLFAICHSSGRGGSDRRLCHKRSLAGSCRSCVVLGVRRVLGLRAAVGGAACGDSDRYFRSVEPRSAREGLCLQRLAHCRLAICFTFTFEAKFIATSSFIRGVRSRRLSLSARPPSQINFKSSDNQAVSSTATKQILI